MVNADHAYEEIKTDLSKTVNTFRRMYGGEVDDLRSLAGELFTIACHEYDPKRADLQGFVHWKIWYGLLNRKRADRPLKMQKLPRQLIGRRQFSLRKLFAEISQDARTIIRLFVDPPAEVTNLASKQGRVEDLRRAVELYLSQSSGWTWLRMGKAFTEIQEALS